MPLIKAIETALKNSFPQSQVQIQDPQGNGYHLHIMIGSPSFAGKSRVIQHQMVYKVLKDQIDDGTLHAITIKTHELQTNDTEKL